VWSFGKVAAVMMMMVLGNILFEVNCENAEEGSATNASPAPFLPLSDPESLITIFKPQWLTQATSPSYLGRFFLVLKIASFFSQELARLVRVLRPGGTVPQLQDFYVQMVQRYMDAI
jgi:hypothetical protein